MPHNSATMNTKSEPAVSSDLVVLLAAPSYDKLTGYTSSLLGTLPDLGRPTKLRVFESELTYAQMVAQETIDPRETEVALIFCGHGEDSSLRGPSAQPEVDDSSFYDNSQHNICPKFMLAFCCDAAKGIGGAYEKLTAGHIFVGFDNRIWFVLEDGVYADWWKKIIHTLASSMLTEADIDEVERAAQQVYKDALRTFRAEKDAEHEWGLLMRPYLRRQFQALNFIQT